MIGVRKPRLPLVNMKTTAIIIAAKITTFLDLPVEKRGAISKTVDLELWHSREESAPSHGV